MRDALRALRFIYIILFQYIYRFQIKNIALVETVPSFCLSNPENSSNVSFLFPLYIVITLFSIYQCILFFYLALFVVVIVLIVSPFDVLNKTSIGNTTYRSGCIWATPRERHSKCLFG